MSEAVKQEPRRMGVYIENEQGEWVVDPEFDREARELYYSGRLFYESNDHRFPAGRYVADGQVVRFTRWYTDNAPAAE